MRRRKKKSLVHHSWLSSLLTSPFSYLNRVLLKQAIGSNSEAVKALETNGLVEYWINESRIDSFGSGELCLLELNYMPHG